MAVRFILGRSGCGKTTWCVSRIVESLLDESADCPLIFLVPEQATYQAERAILGDERITGYDRLNILSFERLAYLILGKRIAQNSLSQIGRQMIVQRLLSENAGRLKIFGAAAGKIGTGQAIAETIAELHQYGRTAEDIDELVETLQKYAPDSITSLKFADIGLIFKKYLKFIEGRFIDPDVQLCRVRNAVNDSAIVKNAIVWVDGFAGFTTAELSILAEVLRSASNASIALCVDPDTLDFSGDAAMLDATSLFGPTEKTYCELLEVIKESKLKTDKPVILRDAERFKNFKALAHIEKQFASPDPRQIKADLGVRLIAAANSRAEAQFAAREILRLVKEKNYRYRDIAVIASDIDYYEHYLRAYLDDYGIPYFIDKRKPLRQHPVIGLVLSALSIVTQGFSRAEVFNFLKTGLTPLSSSGIDLLENYCVAFGIDHGDWQDPKQWDFAGANETQFDNASVDKLRRRVAEPLAQFGNTICEKNINAGQFTKAVFDFLETLGVRQRLNEWVEKSLAQNDTEQANYHQQFSERFADTFDEMAEAFAGMEFDCSGWSQILEAALAQMSLAFIPPRLDQVLVGSIERSRHPDLKAVFLIGCTQKQFPSPLVYDCVLTDSDRTVADKVDFALGPSLRDELAHREYLAYIAFTRPSEYLCASFPLVDEKGSAVVCSRYVKRLESLFSDLHTEITDLQRFDISSVNTKSELAQIICQGAGAEAEDNEQSKNLRLLANELRGDDELRQTGESINYALDYDNDAQLDKAFASEIFGKSMGASATRLGSFASCPYQHFAKYVLGLKERKEFKFEPLDKGLFYHKVLDSLIKYLNERKTDITQIDENELLKILHGRLEELLRQDSFTRNFNARSKHNAYIICSAGQSLEAFVPAMAEMMRAGEFRAKISEAKFGDADSSLGRCVLSCDGREIILNGLIDRLDVAKINSQQAGLIFDYKLSGRNFKFYKFYYGIDLQLGIYLLAIKAAGFEPAGAFFVPIESLARRSDFAELEKRSGKFGYKSNGIFLGQYAERIDKTAQSGWSSYYNFGISKNDGCYGYYASSGALRPADFEQLLKFTERKICSLTKEITQGKIAVAPYRLGTEIPCGWCKYRSVCRFDWQINDYRSLEVLKKTDVLSRMEGVE
ncbi:MAG: PD-(D/E)XK nuclease family protein [Phycisphaerae bacterium]|jgi:ATP-dependent helicase/nuclease subunit B